MNSDQQQIKALAANLNANFYLLAEFITGTPYGVLGRMPEFMFRITQALKDLKKIHDAASRYDLEYATAEEVNELIPGIGATFSRTHYWHYSPIFEQSVLGLIFTEWSNINPKIAKWHTLASATHLKYIDVGCGNGTLLFALAKNGVLKENLLGIDISGKAVDRTLEQGIPALKGTLSEIRPYADAIFLSYFIDRDSDQKATFDTAVAGLPEGGLLVIEGLFPCILNDTNGISYGTANITSGISAEGDIENVVIYLKTISMRICSIMTGERLVYSLDGPEVLPTTILVFIKCA